MHRKTNIKKFRSEKTRKIAADPLPHSRIIDTKRKNHNSLEFLWWAARYF